MQHPFASVFSFPYVTYSISEIIRMCADHFSLWVISDDHSRDHCYHSKYYHLILDVVILLPIKIYRMRLAYRHH